MKLDIKDEAKVRNKKPVILHLSLEMTNFICTFTYNLVAMQNDFLCPSCLNILNIGNNVVFSTRNKEKREGLIILHPELGDYTIVKHPGFVFEKGDRIDFFCPYCSKKLTSDRNENLAKVIMRDENRVEYEIHFSRIVGEHSTYKIIGMTVEIYGEDASEYLDFLNLTQTF